MQIFKRRPLALGCFGLLCALGLSFALGSRGYSCLPLLLLLGASALLCLLFACIGRRRETLCRRLAVASLALALAAAGALLAYTAYERPAREANAALGAGTVTVAVEELSHVAEYGSMGLGRLLLPDGGEIAVRFSVPIECEPGTVLTGEGVVQPFDRLEYDFAARDYYLSLGVLLDVELERVTEIRPGVSQGFGATLRAWNDRLRAILQVELDRDVWGLISGMVLGNREDVPRAARRDFAELGISHLLALSGLHLAVLCGLFERLLFGVPRRLRYGALILLAALYACLTGASPSVLRAAIMLGAVYLSFFLGRRSDTVTVLLAVAAVLCVADPFALLSLSFQLSFLATLACVTVSGLRSRRMPGRWWQEALRGLGDSVLSGFFVCLVTLPALGQAVGRTSLLAPLANLFFIPLSNLLLTLCPLLFLLRPIPLVSGVVRLAVESLSELLLASSAAAASRHLGVFSMTGTATAVLLGLLAAALLLLFVLGPRAKRKMLCASLLLFALVFVSAGAEDALHREETALTAISYKNNDVFTVETDGTHYLIDVSDGSISALGKGAASLRAEGCGRIDGLILTHYHQRHIRSLRRVAEESYLACLCLPAPKGEEEQALFEALCREAEALGVSVSVYRRSGENTLLLGEGELILMDYATLSRSTHPLIGFAYRADGRTFAYLGLSLEEDNSDFARRMLAEAELVYLGSHGPVQKKPWEGRAEGAVFVTAVSAAHYGGETVGTVREKQRFVLP